MLETFIKSTWRNMVRNKLYSLINIACMALGIVCGLVIFLIVKYELSFDNYHSDADRIHRIVSTINEFGETSFGPGVPHPLPRALRNDFPEVQQVTIVDRNFTPSVFAVTRNDGTIEKFTQDEGVAFVDGDYFKIFSYKWILGDPDDALSAPGSVVLSQELATKFFGRENPLGKRLLYDNQHEVQVTGVVAGVASNTELPFNMLIHYDFDERGSDDWGDVASVVQCYLKLPSGSNQTAFEGRLQTFKTKYLKPNRAEKTTYWLQPIRALHFDTRLSTFSGRTVARESLFALGLIGFILLATACINFVNLNTALAVRRCKEVGVRKVLGGTFGQLVLHFLAETAFIMLIAILLSFALAEIALGQLQAFLGYQLDLRLFSDSSAQLFVFVLFVALTIGAGYYPALHLARLNASAALRNKTAGGYGKGLSLRKGLVLAQFAISQALIVCTIVLSSQMHYFHNADMGFNKEAVVEAAIPTNKQMRLARLKQALLQNPAIKHVSFSNTGTASNSTWRGNYSLADMSEVRVGQAQVKFVDQDFIAVYELKLLAGEGFSITDTLKKVIVNQVLAGEAGYGDNPVGLIGKYIKIWGREAPVAGVVKDFHTNSLVQELEPVIMLMQNRFWQVAMRIDLRNMEGALTTIQQAWSDVFPEYVLEYTFLNETIAGFYENEQKTAGLINIFTFVAIGIGCMGLFGLVSYMATQRTKEIGVRKVLGASVTNVVALLSQDFVKLVLLANVIAWPIAWYAMNMWLQNFAYRIDIGWWMFALSGGLALVIALVTVSTQAIRAAVANPVESLRYE